MHTIFVFLKSHWQGLLGAALAGRVIWSLYRNQDFKEHHNYLLFGIVATVVAFILGAMLGSSSGHSIIGWLCGAGLALFPLYFLARTTDRAFKDLLGGLICDLVFSEGSFAEQPYSDKKLPSITLLNHWRSAGLAGKAWRAARRSLVHDQRAFPIWLFSLEMLCFHHRNVIRGRRLLARLCSSKAFSDDQKIYAAREFKGWAARLGTHVDITDLEQPSRCISDPIRQAARLRQQGYCEEAAMKLELLFHREPDNHAAAMLLMRILTQDLRRRDKAEKLLRQLEKQPYVSDAFLDYSRRSLDEWESLSPHSAPRKRSWWQRLTQPIPKPVAKPIILRAEPAPARTSSDRPEDLAALTVRELLNRGYLGTALELATRHHERTPDNFQNFKDLIEILTQHAPNTKRAEKLVLAATKSGVFDQNQMEEIKRLIA